LFPSVLPLFAILQIIRASCPSGWELVSNGQCRGFVGNASAFWDERGINTAVQKCNSIDASVVSIHNDEQQAYWTGKSPHENMLAIGLICLSGSTKWQWSDHSPFDYKPRNYHSALDKSCKGGCTWDIKTDGLWDFNCDGNQIYCEDIWCTTDLEQPAPSADGCESFQDDSQDGIC
ncbi:hypothetical protein PMAYCL1PPCAC_22197, partial [Pristionchus mayeri]